MSLKNKNNKITNAIGLTGDQDDKKSLVNPGTAILAEGRSRTSSARVEWDWKVRKRTCQVQTILSRSSAVQEQKQSGS